MPDAPYQNREIDEKFSDIKSALDRIETQTSKTNGRVTRIERILLVIGTATGVLMATNGRDLVGFIGSIL